MGIGLHRDNKSQQRALPESVGEASVLGAEFIQKQNANSLAVT